MIPYRIYMLIRRNWPTNFFHDYYQVGTSQVLFIWEQDGQNNGYDFIRYVCVYVFYTYLTF